MFSMNKLCGNYETVAVLFSDFIYTVVFIITTTYWLCGDVKSLSAFNEVC